MALLRTPREHWELHGGPLKLIIDPTIVLENPQCTVLAFKKGRRAGPSEIANDYTGPPLFGLGKNAAAVGNKTTIEKAPKQSTKEFQYFDDEASISSESDPNEMADGEDLSDNDMADGEDLSDDDMADGEDLSDDDMAYGEDLSDDDMADGEDLSDDDTVEYSDLDNDQPHRECDATRRQQAAETNRVADESYETDLQDDACGTWLPEN